FEGYSNNLKYYEYSIQRGNDYNIINKISIKDLPDIEFASGSACAENVFVLFAFQKDCDSYKLIIVFKFLAANTRKVFEIKLSVEQVENMVFTFSHTTTSNMYKDFIYTYQRECGLMAAGTTIIKQMEILSNAEMCSGDDNKPDPNCTYVTEEGCIACKSPMV